MIKLNITACANGTLSLDSRQRIRSALQMELRRGAPFCHPVFDKFVAEVAGAIAKDIAAKSPRYLHLHQPPSYPK